MGLKLLTSNNVPALASQSAGIIGVSHRVWPTLISFLTTMLFLKMCKTHSHARVFAYCSVYKSLPIDMNLVSSSPSSGSLFKYYLNNEADYPTYNSKLIHLPCLIFLSKLYNHMTHLLVRLPLLECKLHEDRDFLVLFAAVSYSYNSPRCIGYSLNIC